MKLSLSSSGEISSVITRPKRHYRDIIRATIKLTSKCTCQYQTADMWITIRSQNWRSTNEEIAHIASSYKVSKTKVYYFKQQEKIPWQGQISSEQRLPFNLKPDWEIGIYACLSKKQNGALKNHRKAKPHFANWKSLTSFSILRQFYNLQISERERNFQFGKRKRFKPFRT